MIFSVNASLRSGIDSSTSNPAPLGDSYVFRSQVVVTPASDIVMLSGAPMCGYEIRHVPPVMASAGVLKALWLYEDVNPPFIFRDEEDVASESPKI